MSEKEARVQQYLDDKGFARKRSGYRYLTVGIEIAMEHPGMACQDICKEISRRIPDCASPKEAYRNCTYAIAKSTCKELTTYSFILEAADILRRNN